MAFIQVEVDAVAQMWEFKMHFRAGNSDFSEKELSTWLSDFKATDFHGKLSIMRIGVPCWSGFSDEKNVKWYQFTCSRRHKGESALQIFNYVFTNARPLRRKFLVLKLTDTSAIFVGKTGIPPSEPFAFDYLMTNKDFCEREKSAVEEFQQNVHKGFTPNFALLMSISEKYGINSGHWTCYFGHSDVDKDARVDRTWRALVRSYWHGPLAQSFVVGIAAKEASDGYSLSKCCNVTDCYVFVLYSSSSGAILGNRQSDRVQMQKSFALDFYRTQGCTNEETMSQQEVFRTEKLMRMSGILEPMKYKPDIYSVMEIYHGNLLGLRPTIYCSRAYASERYSYIDSDYTNGYKPDVEFHGEVWYNVWSTN